MPRDTITALRIEGTRSVERALPDLRGLTVLIGDNGSGKSTLIEACELLRRAAANRFFDEFHQIHGGFFSLLRGGAASICLGVDVSGAGEKLRYDVTLTKDGDLSVIAGEQLDLVPASGSGEPLHVIQRDRSGVRVYQNGSLQPIQISTGELAVAIASGPFAPHPAITRMRRALAAIEVHVPFEVSAPRLSLRSPLPRSWCSRRRTPEMARVTVLYEDSRAIRTNSFAPRATPYGVACRRLIASSCS